MSEEILSEFIEELSKRNEPAPRDLFEKYERKGLPASEMAAAAMAHAAILGPSVPAAAYERSAQRMREITGRMQAQPGPAEPRLTIGDRLARFLRRLFQVDE